MFLMTPLTAYAVAHNFAALGMKVLAARFQDLGDYLSLKGPRMIAFDPEIANAIAQMEEK